MGDEEVRRAVIAESGDLIAPLVMAAVSLVVSLLLPFGAAAWLWWIAAIVLLILTRRAIGKAER